LGVESRFVVAHSPDGARAVWVRFTRSGTLSEAWCVAFSGNESAAAQWPAEWNGAWASGGANAKFALTIEPAFAAAALLDASQPMGRWSRKSLTTPVPNGVVRGEVETALGHWSLDGWLGTSGLNSGARWARDYVWAQAPFAGGWFELVSSRLHLGPLRSPRLTLALLHLGGVTHRFERLREPSVHRSAQALTAVSENAEGELFVKVFAAHLLALDYMQPNGTKTMVRNSSRADLELRWTPLGGPAQEILLAGGAALEFGDR
jgi:hypothetical protein